MNHCPFCTRFFISKNFDKTYKKGFIVRYKAVMLCETFYTCIDNKHFCGLKYHPPVSLNYCPVCGKKLIDTKGEPQT